MARLEKSVIGNFRGRLGQLSARIRHGRTILSARPSSFNVSNLPEQINIRKRFGVAIQLAKVINNNPDLQKIWRDTSPEGLTPFNFIIKVNFEYAQTDRPTDKNVLTPGGFSFNVTSAVTGTDDITVELPALNIYKNFSTDEKDLTVYIALIPFEPADAQYDFFKIIFLKHTEVNYDPASALNFTVNLSASEKNLLTNYNQKLLLLCLATKGVDSKIIMYSGTYGKMN